LPTHPKASITPHPGGLKRKAGRSPSDRPFLLAICKFSAPSGRIGRREKTSLTPNQRRRFRARVISPIRLGCAGTTKLRRGPLRKRVGRAEVGTPRLFFLHRS